MIIVLMRNLIWIDGVSIEHMDTICTSLYDLSQKYHELKSNTFFKILSMT